MNHRPNSSFTLMASAGGLVTAVIWLALDNWVWEIPLLAVASVLLCPWILVGVVLDLSVEVLTVQNAVFLSCSTFANMVLWGLVGAWFLEPWSKNRERPADGSWALPDRVLLGQVLALLLLLLLAWVWELAGWPLLPRAAVLAGALLILGGLLGALRAEWRASNPAGSGQMLS